MRQVAIHVVEKWHLSNNSLAVFMAVTGRYVNIRTHILDHATNSELRSIGMVPMDMLSNILVP